MRKIKKVKHGTFPLFNSDEVIGVSWSHGTSGSKLRSDTDNDAEERVSYMCVQHEDYVSLWTVSGL